MKESFAPLLAGFLVATLQLASTPHLLAFGSGPVGGPFSNGSYFPNDGTFSAVVRGENLSGTVQFSTTAGAGATGAGSTGVATIFYDGDTYIGNSQGAYDPQASTMEVNFQARVEGQGQQSISVGKQVTNTTTTNGTTTTSTTTIPYRQINYFDSLYLNGYAECQTTNAFPNQKFKGSGEAELQYYIFSGNTPVLNALRVPLSVSGVRLSNTASTFATEIVRPPSVNEFSVLVP